MNASRMEEPKDQTNGKKGNNIQNNAMQHAKYRVESDRTVNSSKQSRQHLAAESHTWRKQRGTAENAQGRQIPARILFREAELYHPPIPFQRNNLAPFSGNMAARQASFPE